MLKKILRTTLKVFMWIFIGVFSLLLIAVIALQFPQTQKFITSKAVAFLEGKIKTRVEVGGVNVGFPKSIVLEDIYIEDQKQDTLLFAHRIAVDIDMLGLLSNKVEVNNIELETITAHVQRTMPDSASNYDFIVEAFASDSTKAAQPKDTTKSNMEIKVLGLELKDIYLTYKDEVSGTDAYLKLGEFQVEMDEFDLNKNKFHIDNIKLHNTVATLVQSKLPTSEENPEKEPLDLDFGLSEANFSSVKVKYDNKVNKQFVNLNLGELNITADNIDLINQKIVLDEIELNNTSIIYAQKPSTIKDTLVHEKVAKKVSREVEQEAKETGKPWTLTLKELKMVSNNLKFDDFNTPAQKEGMDFKHLKVEGLAMEIEDIYYSGQEISADINQLVFREKSGFRINEFNTKLKVDSTSATLANLNLKTGNTRLGNHLEIGFASLDRIADDIGNLRVNLDLKENIIGFRDILYFQPDLAKDLPFAGNENLKIRLNGKVKGKVNNLNIPSFHLSALGSTVLRASGNMKGLPDMDKAFIDMKVTKLSTTERDIRGFVPSSMIPKTIGIPSKINIVANFKGYLKNFDADANVKTSFGDILANIRMSPPQNGKEVYKATLDVNNLQLGKLLKNDTLYGPLSLNAKVDGVGLTPETIAANLKANIEKAVFQGYKYTNLTIDGRVIQKEFIGKVNYEDQNLSFAFNGDLNFNEDSPKYKFTLDLKGADFKGLKLSEDDLRLKTKISADLVGSDLNDINGDLSISETLVIKNEERYNVNSFLFASINEKRRTDIKIESDIFDANFRGTINLGDLGTTIQQHFNQYFSLNDTTIKKFTEEQNFEFDMVIKNSDLLTEVLVPGLTKLRPGQINGKFNSKASNLAMTIEMPEVQYSNISVQDFAFRTNSNRERMLYEVSINNVSQDSTEIRNILLGGNIKDNEIMTAFSISDDEKKKKFVIGGLLKSVEDAFRFKFNQVVLNYDKWSVNQDNFLEFGGEKFFANNVKLEHNNQYLILNTINRKEKVPDFEVRLNNFQLSFISGLTQNNQLKVGGALNGNVILEKFPGGGSFTSDLKINNFSFKEDTLGNISLLASNRKANQYDVDLKIKGNGNNINMDGYYLADTAGNKLNFNLDIANINLSTIEPYTAGQASKMSGSINGKIKIKGSTSAPDIDGSINFKEAGANITYLKSYFLLDNETIKVDKRGVHFNKFDVIDERNNKATIDGSVLSSDFTNFDLNLDVNTENFRLLNTSAADNDLFFGKVLVDSRIKIRGNANTPRIEARVKLEKDTDFTFAIPASDPSAASREGIVEFVDYSNKINPIVKKEARQDTMKSELKGINLTASIDVDKNAKFNIIIDKERGDVLNLKGSTNEMVFAMDESGKITLSGRYVVNEGNYKLSFYGLVNKDFALKKGSTLVWAGEPLDAKVDIAAIHTVSTNSVNLMNGSPEARYRKRLPYQVYLNMKGELMQPDISFDINLPEKEAALYEELNGRLRLINQNESAKNQQVFALIILGGFISDNSLSTGNQSSIAGTARGSVSEVLSQQLNNLSDKYVKGFDINVGVESYEDYSTGGSPEGRTELNVGVSKQLFNDRVEVQVGSNINLEGSNSDPQRKTSNNLVGDMSVLYKITEDGRYRLRAFRETDVEQAWGEIIKTGASLQFVREYNRLSELFKKSEDEEELQLIEEEEKKQSSN